jgi:dethiobiotin synthetase
MKYFITAIGTDSGKTIVSAIFAEALKADYWKPIQAGYPTDTHTVRGLVSNRSTQFHKEACLLNTPASPHAAAKLEQKKIRLASFMLPNTERELIIEGAGGILVPVNDQEHVIDLAKQFDCDVVLVCNLYLGSINHSLLSLDYLANKGYRLIGIVFNGVSNPESEAIILKKAEVPCLLRIEQEPIIDQHTIKKYANILKSNLTDERTTR